MKGKESIAHRAVSLEQYWVVLRIQDTDSSWAPLTMMEDSCTHKKRKVGEGFDLDTGKSPSPTDTWTQINGLTVADYECPICLELLLNPVAGECGHDFCLNCITEWMETSLSDKPQCPICRVLLGTPNGAKLYPCHRIRNQIEKLFPEAMRERRKAEELRHEEQARAREARKNARTAREIQRHLDELRRSHLPQPQPYIPVDRMDSHPQAGQRLSPWLLRRDSPVSARQPTAMGPDHPAGSLGRVSTQPTTWPAGTRGTQMGMVGGSAVTLVPQPLVAGLPPRDQGPRVSHSPGPLLRSSSTPINTSDLMVAPQIPGPWRTQSNLEEFMGAFRAPSWQTGADLPIRHSVLNEVIQIVNSKRPLTAPPSTWHRLPHFARNLEERLYRTAASLEEYCDLRTLERRLQSVARDLIAERTRGAGPGPVLQVGGTPGDAERR